jgi:hypothetical protein
MTRSVVPPPAPEHVKLCDLSPSDALRLLYGGVQTGEVVLLHRARKPHTVYPYFGVVMSGDIDSTLVTIEKVINHLGECGDTAYLSLNPFSARKVEEHAGEKLPAEWTGVGYDAKKKLPEGSWAAASLSRITAISGLHATTEEPRDDGRLDTEESMLRFFEVVEQLRLAPTLMEVSTGYSPVWLLSEPMPYTGDKASTVRSITEGMIELVRSAGGVDEDTYNMINPPVRAPLSTRSISTFKRVDDGRLYQLSELAILQEKRRRKSEDDGTSVTRRKSSVTPEGAARKRVAPSHSFVKDIKKLIPEWSFDLTGRTRDVVVNTSWHLRKIERQLQDARFKGAPDDAVHRMLKQISDTCAEQLLKLIERCTIDLTKAEVLRIARGKLWTRPTSPEKLANRWNVTADQVMRLQLKTIRPTYVREGAEFKKRERKAERERLSTVRDNKIRQLILDGASTEDDVTPVFVPGDMRVGLVMGA